MDPVRPFRAWRLIDTEPQTPAWHAACDAALLEAGIAGLSPDALVFASFNAPCLRIGAHQLASEFNLEDCRSKGLDLRRRVTGGPALLADARQVAFNVRISRKRAGLDFVDRLNGAVAHALQQLGCPAEARPRGPEVGGKRIGWITSAAEGDSLMVQGQIYVQVELEELARLAPSKTPLTSLYEVGAGAAPAPDEIRQAIVHAFEERFETAIDTGEWTTEERALLAEKTPAMRRDDGLASVRLPDGPVSEATLSSKGGTLRATVLPGDDRKKIRLVRFTGDFCVHPRRLLRDLEAALENSNIDETPGLVEDFFAKTNGEAPGLTSGDFFTALSLAFMKRRVALSAAPDPAAWKKQIQ